MKKALLILIFLPQLLFAQDIYDDPRKGNTSPIPNLKSLTINAFVETRKNPRPNDSMFVQTMNYDRSGRMTGDSYRCVMEKSMYRDWSVYKYNEVGFTRLHYVNGSVYDSVVVARDSAWRYYSGRLEHLYFRDTVREMETRDGIPVLDVGRCLSCRDSFWDYRHAGKLSKKTTSKGKTTDTVRYYGEDNKVRVMIVNFYSESSHIIQSDYYNYGKSEFTFREYPYTENMSMVYWLRKSKQNKTSYTVKRKFNEDGLLIEERIAGIFKAEGTTILKYNYEFYN